MINARKALLSPIAVCVAVAALAVIAFVFQPSAAEATSFDVPVGGACPDEAEVGDSCGTTTSPGTCQGVVEGALSCEAATSTPTDAGTATAATTIAPRDLPNPLARECNSETMTPEEYRRCQDVGIPDIIARVITIFTGVAGSIALLMFVYGGVMWLASGGKSEQIEKGKKAIVWAVIGMAVIFGGYAILRAIFTALGARL